MSIVFIIIIGNFELGYVLSLLISLYFLFVVYTKQIYAKLLFKSSCLRVKNASLTYSCSIYLKCLYIYTWKKFGGINSCYLVEWINMVISCVHLFIKNSFSRPYINLNMSRVLCILYSHTFIKFDKETRFLNHLNWYLVPTDWNR